MDYSTLKLNQRVILDLDVKKDNEGNEDRQYVLDIVARPDHVQYASILSDGSVTISNGFTYQVIRKLDTKLNSTVGIQYQEDAPYNLYTVNQTGTFQVWDSNTGALLKSYDFGVSVYSFNILCGGSLLLLGSDSHIIFVDIATGNLVGTYKDVHSEPVTQIIRHPLYNTVFMSGSEDGLICIFDISRGNQDESLVTILNIDSAVERLGWWGENMEMIWCISMTRGIFLYNSRTSDLIKGIADATNILENRNIILDYLVGLIFNENTPLLLAGDEQHNLYVIQFNDKPSVINTLVGHKDIVRCYTILNKCFITGAEDSSLCIWTSGYQIQQSSLKQQRERKTFSNKPYTK
ncbi:hypothetical protein WA158_007468 [Blastocystis sp. Blastoise]